MGRKIPGKKHRGIKDPIVQQERRLESIKNKINAPPTNLDEQYIPKSLQHIIDLKQKIKDGTISLKRKRKRKKNKDIVTSAWFKETKVKVTKRGKADKPIPIFTQRPDEDDRIFMNRVNNIVQGVLVENQFEQKYGVDIIRNPSTGEVEKVAKKEKNEVDEMLRKVRKEALKNKKKKKSKLDTEPRLTKAQKRKLKLEKRKERKNANNDDFNKYKDNVKFGEVVHAPPTLVLPKKAIQNEVPRPGKKDLLLKDMILNDSKSADITKYKLNKMKKTSSLVNKKGKRKDLPAATRRQLEMFRDEAVKAYQLLKSKK